MDRTVLTDSYGPTPVFAVHGINKKSGSLFLKNRFSSQFPVLTVRSPDLVRVWKPWLQVVASDIEKNPHGTRVFKTRVLPFSFPAVYSSSSSSSPTKSCSVLLLLPLFFLFSNQIVFLCFFSSPDHLPLSLFFFGSAFSKSSFFFLCLLHIWFFF